MNRLLLSIVLLGCQLHISHPSDAMEIRLTRIYDNVPCDEGLAASWGTSCLVEGLEKSILFDTGGSGRVLLSNMEKLGIDPADIDIVVLSHIHGDHTGGLGSILSANNRVRVYLPSSFPRRFKRDIASSGAEVIEVSGPTGICSGAFSTGEMGKLFKEQALVIESAAGSIIVTGCSHPGVENFVSRAHEITGLRPYLVTGGFHLGFSTAGKVQATIDTLKEMGVQKVGPTHCTGKRAMKMFREAWGGDFVEMGCGARVCVPLPPSAPGRLEEPTTGRTAAGTSSP